MMEHIGYAGGTLSQTTCEDRPYLARISDAADELDRIAGYIEAFIDRCRGGGGNGAKANVPTAVPSGHFGQLERLQDNLGRVDKLARELQIIG